MFSSYHTAQSCSATNPAVSQVGKKKLKLDRPLWFQEVEAPRNSRQLAHVGGRLSALYMAAVPPQEIPKVLIPARGSVNPRAIVWLEGLNE